MLITGKQLTSKPVMSLQTGSELARTGRAIIDPADLKIVGYIVEGPLLEYSPSFLRVDDVRELSDIGFIVDSADEFVASGDVIALDNIISYNFDPLSMTVRSEKGGKLGHVIDYNVDVDNFMIMQLMVKRPLLKSFNDTELIVHRTQIVEINDDAIVVKEHAEVPEHTRKTTPGSYVNPFRSGRSVAPEPADRD